MLPSAPPNDITQPVSPIGRWRQGRIVVQNGQLVQVQRRWLGGNTSMAQVWWQAKYGRADDDLLWLDYHQPRGMPGFLTLDYIRSGKKAGYRSLVRALDVLNEIARIRSVVAIVAHISNAKITDRFLLRQGWQQHMPDWQGRHWIRRFYDGY